MALKDWKKLKNNYPFVKGFYTNGRSHITIKHISAVGKAPYRYPETYDVILNFKKLLKECKTKSSALAFAKAYMRKH